MTAVLVLLLIVAAVGVAFFVLRAQARRAPLSTAARLSRYGLAQKSISQVVSHEDEQSAMGKRVERAIGRGKWAAKVAVKLERADLKMLPSEFITMNMATVVVGMAMGFLLKGLIGVAVGFALGFFGPRFWLNRRVKTRRKKFIEQLADLSQMAGNSMRAGFSILQSMELVAKEAQQPAAGEFERVVTEVKLGLTLEAALDHLLQRMPSEDLELMIVAINVQRQVGGNLAEILMVISNTIRLRVRFERDLKALTAQAKYSSYIITALPIGVAIAINLLDPTYESFLWTNIVGWFMVGLAIVMLSIGFFILNKIATIEV